MTKSQLGVPNQLTIVSDKDHGWDLSDREMKQIRDWFDRYLHKR